MPLNLFVDQYLGKILSSTQICELFLNQLVGRRLGVISNNRIVSLGTCLKIKEASDKLFLLLATGYTGKIESLVVLDS